MKRRAAGIGHWARAYAAWAWSGLVRAGRWARWRVLYGREWLFVGLGFFALGQVALYYYSASEGDIRMDQVMVFWIASAAIIYSIGMVAGTVKWTARSTGVLFTFLATAIYWGYSWYYSVTRPPEPPNEAIIDAARDFWIIGVPLSIIGWTGWARRRWWDGRKRDDE